MRAGVKVGVGVAHGTVVRGRGLGVDIALERIVAGHQSGVLCKRRLQLADFQTHLVVQGS